MHVKRALKKLLLALMNYTPILVLPVMWEAFGENAILFLLPFLLLLSAANGICAKTAPRALLLHGHLLAAALLGTYYGMPKLFDWMARYFSKPDGNFSADNLLHLKDTFHIRVPQSTEGVYIRVAVVILSLGLLCAVLRVLFDRYLRARLAPRLSRLHMLMLLNCLPVPLFAAFFWGGGNAALLFGLAAPPVLLFVDSVCTETRKDRAAVLLSLWISCVVGIQLIGWLYLQIIYNDSIGA